MKVGVEFKMDLKGFDPHLDNLPEGERTHAVEDIVRKMMLNEIRASARSAIRSIHSDPNLSHDDKLIKSADNLRKIMLTIMAELNCTVTELPEDTVIETEMPFEKAA